MFLVLALAVTLALWAGRLASYNPAGLLLLTVGGFALAATLAKATSRSLTGPIKRLTAALRDAELSGRLTPGFSGNSLLPELNALAEALNGAAHSVHVSEAQLDSAYLQFAETMARALDARDPYTAGHSIRVGAYASAIAQAMDLPMVQSETIRIAAQLHDIGKIGVPDAILQKPGSLTAEEYGLIKLHPQIGRRILERTSRFEKLLSVVELHHENYDGTGYPYRLIGEAIPLEARIVRVADAFDSMTTNRAYRAALPFEAALDELRACRGTDFDPRVTAVFLELIANGKHQEALLETDHGLVSAYRSHLLRAL